MNINIDIYLRSAFQELSAFSIQDVGTFRKINRSSWIDESGLHLHPPGTDIEFSSIVDRSVLLSDYFRHKIGLNPDAAEQISTQIREVILREVQQKGKFEIPEIGLLKNTDTQTLTFENYETKSNVLSDNYFGLSPMSITEPVTVLASFDKNTDMKKSNRPESKQSLSTIGLKSSIIVALLFALGFILLNQSPLIIHRSSLTQGLKVRFNAPSSIEDRLAARKPIESKNDQEEIAEPLEEEKAPEELKEALKRGTKPAANSRGITNTESSSQQEEIVPAIEELLADGGPVEKTTDQLGTSRGQEVNPTARLRKNEEGFANDSDIEYHLIVGSFKSLSIANKAVSKWKTQGYDAIVLFPPAGSSLTHRVSVYKSISRTSVEGFATRLKDKGNKSTWIYEEKKQN